MRAWCWSWVLVAWGLALPEPVQAQARSFSIEEGSQAQFVSDAPLERITGVASRVRGNITLDPQKPAEARGEVRVAVSSIRTNVDLRDEHLRSDKWLDAARFPDAIFTLTGVSGQLVPNQASELSLNGKFEVHGVKRDVSTTARVRYVPAAAGGRDTLRVQASFMVSLESHGVSIPSIVALKVAKSVRVNVDLRASAPSEKPAVAVTPEPAAAPAPPVAEPVAEPSAPEKPAAKPAQTSEKPRPAATTRPVKPRPDPQADPATARPTPEAPASAPLPSRPLAGAPTTPADAADAVTALLRKAHHELVHGDATRALRFVQQAQKLMPRVQRGLGAPQAR